MKGAGVLGRRGEGAENIYLTLHSHCQNEPALQGTCCRFKGNTRWETSEQRPYGRSRTPGTILNWTELSSQHVEGGFS